MLPKCLPSSENSTLLLPVHAGSQPLSSLSSCLFERPFRSANKEREFGFLCQSALALQYLGYPSSSVAAHALRDVYRRDIPSCVVALSSRSVGTCSRRTAPSALSLLSVSGDRTRFGVWRHFRVISIASTVFPPSTLPTAVGVCVWGRLTRRQVQGSGP